MAAKLRYWDDSRASQESRVWSTDRPRAASSVLQRMGELAWMETSVSRVSSASAPPAAPRVTPRGVDSGSGNLEIGLALHKWAARRAKAKARKMSATI